jgi:hypothetical protein
MCTATINSVIERVVAFAAAQGWPKSRFAKEADLHDTTLRKFGRADWNPTARVLQRLEEVIPPSFCPQQDNKPQKRKGRR